MELELNHRYLVKILGGLTELKCVEITKTSCKVQYENGNTSWFPKNVIKYWQLIEDLGISKFLNDCCDPHGN